MLMNAAAAYNESKITTARPEELTLMLYDGAIKFCNIALISFEKNNIPKVNENIIKAEKIIGELRQTLNFKYPVAKNFEEVYKLIYDILMDANLKKDKELLEQALGYIREMRETWKEAIKVSKE